MTGRPNIDVINCTPRAHAYSAIKRPSVYPCITKGSCTYYVITDRGGVSPNDYGITLASSQIITVLHRGGPANDYGIREAVKNVLADFFC